MTNPKQPKSAKIITEQPKTQATVAPSTAHEANNPPSKKSSSTAKSGNVAIPAKEAETSVKKRKPVKEKVIRDSFSFPEHDYLKISKLKQTCLAEGIHVKKGELLRAGLLLLSKLSLTELKKAVEQVEKVKTGRPNS